MLYNFNWEVTSQPEIAFLRLLTCGGHMSCLWWNMSVIMSHYQFNSVTQSCPTLCDPMNRSTPGLPVHHQLPEFTQTHVHWVSDAIQPSHPLSSPSPAALNLSQHQGLFIESVLHIRWPKYWNFSFSVSPSNDRMWSTGEGNGKPLQYSCPENPMNSMCHYRQSQLRIKGVQRFI